MTRYIIRDRVGGVTLYWGHRGAAYTWVTELHLAIRYDSMTEATLAAMALSLPPGYSVVPVEG